MKNLNEEKKGQKKSDSEKIVNLSEDMYKRESDTGSFEKLMNEQNANKKKLENKKKKNNL